MPSEESLTGCFSPFVYNYEGSHIQKLLNTVIGNEGGAGEILLNSLTTWLNENFPSASQQVCLDIMLFVMPCLTFLMSPLINTPIDYFKTRMENIMSALSIGFTNEGAQKLSQGIFNAPCIITEQNSVQSADANLWSTPDGSGDTVFISPMTAYGPIQAMVYQTIARRIAPMNIQIFVTPCPSQYLPQYNSPETTTLSTEANV